MVDELDEPVVVGVDSSDEARAAVAYGAWEAHRRQVPLRLVSAEHRRWGAVPTRALSGVADGDGELHELLRALEADVADRYPDLAVTSNVVPGTAAGALVAASRHASLVVTGTEASGGVVSRLWGSIASQVATHANAPVVVIRPLAGAVDIPDAWLGRPVVVGVDGSPEAEQAMSFAVEQAVAREADILAVYVWSVVTVHDVGPDVPEGFVFDDEEAKALRLLSEATSGWTERFPDLVWRNRVVHDLNPAYALTEVGEEAGLIVIGSRGHGGFLGLRLGSTADGLIRHAEVPVAVVRSDPGWRRAPDD